MLKPIKLMKKSYNLITVVFTVLLSISAYPQHMSQETDSSLNSELELRITQLNNEIDSLKSSLEILEKLYGKSQGELIQKNNEINSLQQRHALEIQALELRNDSLQKNYIRMASNFLYIPYEDYSIQKIAIPAFQNIKGSNLYQKHKIRLILLENYKADIKFLSNFIDDMIKNKDLGIAFGLTDTRERNKQTKKKELDHTQLVSTYKQYDDWENTFIGVKIKEINRALNISDSEAMISQLKQIQQELESLISN